jgi:serine/threonine protein kinase
MDLFEKKVTSQREHPHFDEIWLLPLPLKLKYEPFENKRIVGSKTRNLDIEDHFQVIEMVGRGGYGIVFSALDSSSDSKIAIKVLLIRK